MSITISGIATSGVSNQFVRNQLINQLSFGETDLYQLEMEISTGHQFQLPSENTAAASQVESIQSLLERKDQMKSNVSATQTYLGQTDSTLTSVSNLLTSIQSTALSAVGATAGDAQRQAAILQIQQAVQELVAQGNQQFGGRQLFGGTNTSSPPFAFDGAGNVVYSGSSTSPQTYVDLNRLFDTSVTGDQAFGAMSQPIPGATLTPAVSSSTPLANLHGGQGVAAGSIAISDGQNTSVVDLRSAKTLGDVALLIEQHPPKGRTISAEVTSTGLTINLQPGAPGDNLTIREVDGNSTANDLGILKTTSAGPGPIVGQSLNTAVTGNTPVADLFGTTAAAYIHFGQPDSDIILQANAAGDKTPDGTLLNNVTVHFVDDRQAAGQETASFDPGTPASGNNPGTPGTLTVHVSTSAVSASNASEIVKAINQAAGLPFTASLDPANQDGGAQPPITSTSLPADTTTSGGSGSTLDAAGLQIVSEGKTYMVDFSGDKTVQDLLNSINGAGAGLDAEINAAGTGIDVRSRISGSSFSIGENGGTTATQLGLRTLTAGTLLAQLNYGQGVGHSTATPPGNDFSISQTLPGPPPSNVQVDVSIAGDATVGDVIGTINSAAQAAGATFHAQLAATGNGIELVEADSTHGPIVITANSQSTAAVDLGLVPAGQTSAQSQMTGGQPIALTGSDVNPQETGSVFNALLKLAAAFQSNDAPAIQRAMGLLSTSMQNLNNARSELGVHEQSLSTISTQIDNEELSLKSAMSNVYDTDMASAVSQYTAAQTSYQATLQTTASLLKMSLLNYV